MHILRSLALLALPFIMCGTGCATKTAVITVTRADTMTPVAGAELRVWVAQKPVRLDWREWTATTDLQGKAVLKLPSKPPIFSLDIRYPYTENGAVFMRECAAGLRVRSLNETWQWDGNCGGEVIIIESLTIAMD